MNICFRRAIAASCLVLIAGCVTEELVVYQDSVLSKDAMQPFLGVYNVEEWPGDMSPKRVRVTEKEGDFSFSWDNPSVDLNFQLSKIPNSKKNLYLLSIPAQADTNQANMFFVGQPNKEQTHIWAVFSTSRVAKDHLTFENGKARAKDVKQFLAKHADALVTANKPQVRLKLENR